MSQPTIEARGKLCLSYEKAFGRPLAPETTIITATELQEDQFKRHGLTTFTLPISGVPTELLIDVPLLSEARFVWVGGMRPSETDVIISSGKQKPSLRRIRAALEIGKKWFVEFNPESLEGIHAMIRYPARVGRRSPEYNIDLIALLHP